MAYEADITGVDKRSWAEKLRSAIAPFFLFLLLLAVSPQFFYQPRETAPAIHVRRMGSIPSLDLNKLSVPKMSAPDALAADPNFYVSAHVIANYSNPTRN